MHTTPDPLDEASFQMPPFDWTAPITAALMKTIAEIGDLDMRLHLAGHPSIDDAASIELLSIGDPEIAAALRKNPATSARIFALAARPKDAARVIRKAVRAADEQAARSRSSFVALLQAEVPGVA